MTDESEEQSGQSPIVSGHVVVTDVLGIGKAAESLKPAGKQIAKAIEHLYSPIDIYLTERAEGAARRHETNADAKALKRLETELASDPATFERFRARFFATEQRRQHNIDQAVIQAVELSEADTESGTAKEIDQGFMADWIDGVQDVSDEAVRALWAKILAAAPKQETSRVVSKPTLELLKQFDKIVAQNFENFIKLVVYGGYPSSRHNEIDRGTGHKVDVSLLTDLGIIENRQGIGPTAFGVLHTKHTGQSADSSRRLPMLATVSIWALRHRAYELANVLYPDLECTDEELGYQLLKGNLNSAADDTLQHLTIEMKLRDKDGFKTLELAHPKNAFVDVSHVEPSDPVFFGKMHDMIDEIRRDCADLPDFGYRVLLDFSKEGRLRIVPDEN